MNNESLCFGGKVEHSIGTTSHEIFAEVNCLVVVEQSDHSPSFAGNPAISLSGVHMNFLLHTGGRKD